MFVERKTGAVFALLEEFKPFKSVLSISLLAHLNIIFVRKYTFIQTVFNQLIYELNSAAWKLFGQAIQPIFHTWRIFQVTCLKINHSTSYVQQRIRFKLVLLHNLKNFF